VSLAAITLCVASPVSVFVIVYVVSLFCESV